MACTCTDDLAPHARRHPPAAGAAPQHQPPAAAPGHPLPAGASAVLRAPTLHGRGNGPVSQALLQQLQQGYGNRATQRLLQTVARLPGRPAVPPRLAVQRHDPHLEEDLPIPAQRQVVVQRRLGESPAQKARRIKQHIVGTSLACTKCYDYARDRYHNPNHPEHDEFKANVDAFVLPEQLPAGEGPEALGLVRLIRRYAYLGNSEQEVLDYIAAHPAIKTTFAENDDYAAGVQRALDETVANGQEKERIRDALQAD